MCYYLLTRLTANKIHTKSKENQSTNLFLSMIIEKNREEGNKKEEI